jgi:hypothetical protein
METRTRKNIEMERSQFYIMSTLQKVCQTEAISLNIEQSTLTLN